MSEDDRRQNIRFNPDQNALAIIHRGGNEENPLIGLLRDESYKGCGAIFHQEYFPYEEGDVVELEANQVGPVESKVSWVKPLDEKLVRAGFNFLE